MGSGDWGLEMRGMRGMRGKTYHQLPYAQFLEAAVLSFADIFRVVGVAFLCSLPLLLFLGKGGAGAKAPVH